MDSSEFRQSLEYFGNSEQRFNALSDVDAVLQVNEEERESKRCKLFDLLKNFVRENSQGMELVERTKATFERLAVIDRSFRRMILLPLKAVGRVDLARVQARKKGLESLHSSTAKAGTSIEGKADHETSVLKAQQEVLEALDTMESSVQRVFENNIELFLAEELRVLKEIAEILSSQAPSAEATKPDNVSLKCQPCADRADQLCCVVVPEGGLEEMEELCPPGLLVKRMKKAAFVERKTVELPPFSHNPAAPTEDQLRQFCDECEEHCPPGAVLCRSVCASGCPPDVKAATVHGNKEGCIAKAIKQVEKARGITETPEGSGEEEEEGEERMVVGKLRGGSGKRERVPSISIQPPEEEGRGRSAAPPSGLSSVSISSASSPAAISPDSDTSPYAAEGPATAIDREGERDKAGDLPDISSSKPRLGRYLTQPFPPPLLRQKARMPLPLPLSDEEEADILRRNEVDSSNAAEGARDATPKTSGDSESTSGKGEEDTKGLGKLNGGSGMGGTAKTQAPEGATSVSGTSVKPQDAPAKHADAAGGPSAPEPTETPPLERVNEIVPQPRGPPFNDYPQKGVKPQPSGPKVSAAVSSALPSTTDSTLATSSPSTSQDNEAKGEESMKGGHLRGGSGKGSATTSSEGKASAQARKVPVSHSSAVLGPVKSVIQGLTKAEEAAAEALWSMEDRVVSVVSELAETGELASTDHDARQEEASARQEAQVKGADELTKHPWPQGSHSQRK